MAARGYVAYENDGRELYWFNSGLIPGAMAGAYQGGLIGAYYI